MGFRESFEKHVNDDMSDTPSSSKPPLRIDTETAPQGLKKRHSITTPALEADTADDHDKFHDRPPRFSTLFGPAALPPRPTERPSSIHRRSGGVFVPTSVFVLLISLIVCEGLALFAYTVIGLYNNLPMRMIHQENELCRCHDGAAVNISPNFFMGNAVPSNAPLPISNAAITASVTLTSSTTTTSSTSTMTSDLAVSSSKAVAAVASDMMKMFDGMKSQAIPTVNTVFNTAFVTVDPSGSLIPPRSTVTAIQVVQASPVIITSTQGKKRSLAWVEAVFDPSATPTPIVATQVL